MKKIAITAFSSLSALGTDTKIIWENYLKGKTFISKENDIWQAKIPQELQAEIEMLRLSDNKYKNLDLTVLYAIYVSRKAVEQAGWKPNGSFGINIGSSRGATELFEKHFADFLQTGAAKTLASPTTTLGNISSWVGNDLRSKGVEFSHSITCSTSLHSLLNGVAWLSADMSDTFLAGGSEASLTPFTFAQMIALNIYSKSEDQQYPCRAFDLNKKENTMIIGEGACVMALEKGEKPNALAYIEGIGYATELLTHNISISADAECFQKSMKMALKNHNISDIDAIVMHAPGTIKGDQSEYNAIQKVFGNEIPFLTTNKWILGHTFGTSGVLSVELALLMLMNQEAIRTPFFEQPNPKQIKKVLINAVGFGGNAVSVIVSSAKTA